METARSFYLQIRRHCISKRGRSGKDFDHKTLEGYLNFLSQKAPSVEEFEEIIVRDIPATMRYILEYDSTEPTRLSGTLRLMQVIKSDIIIPFSHHGPPIAHPAMK